MKTDWDVIVVGAGPAGSMTAARLAPRGVDVLLLDQARFPRDKVCGGGLTPKAFRQLDFDISDLVLHKENRVSLKGPRLAPTPIATPTGEAVWMVRRRDFDTRLVQVAREHGVAFRDGERVTRIETGARTRVETDHGVYRAQVVVGADGAESVVARQVGLRAERNQRHRAVALEAEVPVARDVLEGVALLDYRLHLGYGWIFPKGAVYNIGVGSGDLRIVPQLRAELDRFIAENRLPIVGPVHATGHRIPIWTHAEPLHRSNVILVGDAAGLADALWGEGMSYALMSGQIAALSLWDYLVRSIESFETYTTRIRHLMMGHLRRLYHLAYIVYGLPGMAFPLFARSRRMQQVAAEIISGDRSQTHMWRCACALASSSASRNGRCDPVLRTLVTDCWGCA